MSSGGWTVALPAGGAVLGFLAAAVFSAPQEVVLKGGGTVVGEVTKAGGQVEVRLRDNTVKTYKDAEVQEVRALPPRGVLLRDFEKKKAAVKADDGTALFDLAGWAEDRGLTAQALAIYEAMAAKGNQFAKAHVARLKQSGSTSKVEPKIGKTDPTGRAGDPTGTPVTSENAAVKIDDPLALRRIQLREYAADETPRITVDPKAKLDKNARAEATKALKDPVGAMAYARKAAESSPDLLAALVFAVEPAVLREWHVKNLSQPRPIQDIVVGRCAGAECHGGNNAKFKLITEDIRNPGVAYGNFEFLRRYRDGMMIQVDAPDLGGLLLYGLPDELKNSTLPANVRRHPAVWKGTDEKDYVALRAWIKKLKPGNVVFPPAVPDDPKDKKP